MVSDEEYEKVCRERDAYRANGVKWEREVTRLREALSGVKKFGRYMHPSNGAEMDRFIYAALSAPEEGE